MWPDDSSSQAAGFLGPRAFCIGDDRRVVALFGWRRYFTQNPAPEKGGALWPSILPTLQLSELFILIPDAVRVGSAQRGLEPA